MAKIKIILFHIFLYCSAVSLFGQNTGRELSLPQAPKEDVKTIQAIYSAEIGIRELTGHNDGKRVEEYLASCSLKRGQPWCAAFVTWSFKKAGVKAVISGYSPNWFPTEKTIFTRGSNSNLVPGTADAFGIWFANKKRIAHVGFIDSWPTGSMAITVEGNTNEAGSREGDGIYRKRRLKNQIYKISRWL